MSEHHLSRRAALSLLGAVPLGIALASCAKPTPAAGTSGGASASGAGGAPSSAGGASSSAGGAASSSGAAASSAGVASSAGAGSVAASSAAASGDAKSAGGLISIITNDPSNPFWLAEGNTCKAEAIKLGYKANLSSHGGDTNKESNLIDTAISSHSVAIILDPANAQGSIGAVKKAVAANIPVFLVNAEIDQQGLAKAQLVSNNAQGAALGAQQFVKALGTTKGNYLELYGAPSDNNAQTRSNGYKTVLSQYPDLHEVAKDVANWDRTQGYNKTQSMLQAHPDVIGLISGNDDMAQGAIAALKQAGKIHQVTVGGFDGSPSAIKSIKAGEQAYTVLQPVVTFSKKAVHEADMFLKTGKTGAPQEKQLFDCILITKDMVNDFIAPFTLKSM